MQKATIFTVALLFLTQCLTQNTFSNPAYPNPVYNAIGTSQTYNVDNDHYVALAFREFEVEADDCITMTQTVQVNGGVRISACGSVMSDPSKAKALILPGSARVATVNGNKSDDMPHAGIFADVVTLDQTMHYFTCNQQVDLSTITDSHFVLASQAYPAEPSAYSQGCSITFKNTNNIRFGIYNLAVDPVQDSFSITSSGKTEQFTGYAFTSTAPQVRYYSKEVRADFKFTATSLVTQRGFYILVNGYTEKTKVDGNCAGAVNRAFSPVTIRKNNTNAMYAIGQLGFGQRLYDNSIVCNFDYTKEVKDNWFYIDLHFASEACCDYMDVTGLVSKGTSRFQGAMGHRYYFSKEDQVLMNFAADEIGPAIGFSGFISVLDCSQCGGVLNFGVNMNSASIESPNYMKADLPYCPNMNCKWTINVDYGYYVYFAYQNVQLRQPDNGNDTLDITDRFGTVIRSYYSGGPAVLGESNIITGPTTIEFKSTDQAQFTKDKMGRGFQISLNSYKQQYISNNITLTDAQYFVDLSQNNFNAVAVTDSYLVQARPGKKVSLYFATSIQSQAFVTIWDGQNTNAPLIDTSAAAAAVNENRFVLNAPRVTSTGEYMLIHIRPGSDRGAERYTQDFQAIVSDYENPAQCGSLVKSINPPKGSVSAVIFEFYGANGANCQNIIRATDRTNSQLLQSHWGQINATGQFNLYKGLTLDNNHKLRTDVSPLFVFDRNTVVQWNNAVTFLYSWDYATQYNNPLKIYNGQIGSLMTQDFLPYGQKMTSDAQQSFDITPTGSTKGITLNILRPIGQATVEVKVKNNGAADQTQVYTAANINNKMSFNCDSITVTYTCKDRGTNNGLYATFESGNYTKSQSSISMIAVVMTVLLTNLFL